MKNKHPNAAKGYHVFIYHILYYETFKSKTDIFNIENTNIAQ